MCYGSENTHVFDSGGHVWKRDWDGFRCRKCKLRAHVNRDMKPYACDLIRPEGWDGLLDCASLFDRLLVMKVMGE